MEHTKLPWLALVENLGHGHYGKIKLVTQRHIRESLPAIGEIASPHDAEFIVRACNAHEDLLAICEDATTAIYDAMHAGNLSRNYHDDVMDKIEAAIKKARGE